MTGKLEKQEGFSPIENPTPTQRTIEFFNRDVALVTSSLSGRVIVSQDDGRMIRVDVAEAWPKDKVGDRYIKSKNNLRLGEMQEGTLGVFPLPVRRINQSLIAAKSGTEKGACVRLVRASKHDPDTKSFVSMAKEGDIASFFGFEPNDAVRLSFIDDSDILYFNRGSNGDSIVELPTSVSETETANQYLRDLTGQ